MDVAEEAGGSLRTFGSYRLGVHNKGADIDALVLTPFYITREDFFSSLYKKLDEHPDVKDLHAVTDAFVPTMKLEFDGIEFDLLFARMMGPKVPEDIDLTKDSVLKEIPATSCIRSVNGEPLVLYQVEMQLPHTPFANIRLPGHGQDSEPGTESKFVPPRPEDHQVVGEAKGHLQQRHWVSGWRSMGNARRTHLPGKSRVAVVGLSAIRVVLPLNRVCLFLILIDRAAAALSTGLTLDRA